MRASALRLQLHSTLRKEPLASCVERNRPRKAKLDLLRVRRWWPGAAAIYPLIETARHNDVDPRAWLARVLAKLPDHSAKQIDDMLPWLAWPTPSPKRLTKVFSTRPYTRGLAG